MQFIVIFLHCALWEGKGTAQGTGYPHSVLVLTSELSDNDELAKKLWMTYIIRYYI